MGQNDNYVIDDNGAWSDPSSALEWYRAELKKKLGIWQPIETAPKDGTEVLVYFDCSSVPIVHIAWYRSREEWEREGQYCGGWDSLEEWEGWWSYTRTCVRQEKVVPTHWMALPEVK